MKRFSTALVVAVLVAFAAPIMANPFSDVPFSHWAFDAVKTLTEKGIMTGMPDGTFKGEKSVSRYELAVTLARTLDKLGVGGLKGKIDATDVKTLEKLTVEFADELALLGVKVTALEDELQTVRDDIAVIKADVKKGGCGGCEGGKIAISGDSRIHIDSLKYENDVTGVGAAKDDLYSFYQIGLNFSAAIDEDISTFFRITNDDIVGNEFDNLENQNFGIDLAYVDVKKFFDLGDVRIGRQFVKVGHSIVLDDKIDAIHFGKAIDKMDFSFFMADLPVTVMGVPENGFGLKGLDVKYAFGEHDAELYYAINSFAGNPGMDPTTYGLALDGGLVKEVDYLLEYANSDPDVAGANDGTALLGGVSWDFTEKLGVKILYGKGDEEFFPISIYTNHRYEDMFGVLPAGNIVRTGFGAVDSLATGSLAGIKDMFVKFDAELTEKTEGCLIYEKVDANETDNNVATAANEYKRMTLGLDHQYAPNTAFGVRYDTVEFDLDATNTAANAGGWNRIRVEVKVKF